MRNEREEYDRGYHGYGETSYEASRGARARREDDARAMREAMTPPPQSFDPVQRRAVHRPERPATFGGSVRGMAVLGLALGAGYAFFLLAPVSLVSVALWSLVGMALGAVAGVLLYAVILILRAIMAVLAVLLRVAIVIALIAGALYVISQ